MKPPYFGYFALDQNQKQKLLMNAYRNVDDFNDFLFKEIIEEEFEHLSSKYGHLFKKLTLEEFQDLLDNMNFPADVYVPSII